MNLERARIITFKAPLELAEALEKYARRVGRSKSEVIREALLLYFKSKGIDIGLDPVVVSRASDSDRGLLIELDEVVL